VVAALFALDLLAESVAESWLGFDFEGTLWDPALAIREGRSPYPAPVVSEVDVGNPALYPPLLMLVVTPLTLLPWSIGLAVWLAVLGAAVVGTLYALDVRDPRCYALALISAPVMSGLLWGNATLLLLPLVALAWRWRDRWPRSGVLVGLALAAKLFLWPLLFWLVGTRRYRAAATALGTALAGLFIPWAVIGFSGLSSYPDLLEVAEQVYAVHSVSVATMLSALGFGASGATAVTLAVGMSFGALALVAGRRRDDELSLCLALLAALLGSPILWDYYYAFLFVPIAIARPRLSALWLLPLALYLTSSLPWARLPADEFTSGGSACCKPAGTPVASWIFNHSPPALWPALGHALVAAVVFGVSVWSLRRLRECPPAG
jgi:hypothetical protein